MPDPDPSLPDQENVTSQPPVSVLPLAGRFHVAIGAVLSIRLTVNGVDQVLPTRSEKVKVNVPLPVKRCPVSLIPVSASEYPVRLIYTLPPVQAPVAGDHEASGVIVSV